jgi:hypothetical protein
VLQNRAVADIPAFNNAAAVTKRFTWDVSFAVGPESPGSTKTGLYSYMNNVSMSTTPTSPSLLERYTNNPEGLGAPVNAAAPAGGTIRGWNVVELEEGDVVEIVLNNLTPGECSCNGLVTSDTSYLVTRVFCVARLTVSSS